MKYRPFGNGLFRASLFGCSVIVGATGLARAAPQTSPTIAAGDQSTTVSDIVVTAQRRAQNLQDVPISIAAVNQQAMVGNRIINVIDLSNIVPNLDVKNAAGDVGLPAFTLRGVTSYGSVPGSDKEISIYIDGVYIGSATGSAFDLADIDRIEVLRGPQGTLFGRDATAGAISITTPDPTGQFGAHQEFTYGNYDQFRSKTRINLPQWGPFSAAVSYVHDQRRGDIKNLGAGAVWYRPEPDIKEPVRQVSPAYLGDKDENDLLVALKFQPVDQFKMVYKFDYGENHGTPEGVAPVGIYPAALGPAGIILTTAIGTQPTPVVFDGSAQRPRALNNWFSTPDYQQDYGHSLTTQYRVNDQITLKNILAYRHSFVWSNVQLDGLGGLQVTPALAQIFQAPALTGAPFGVLVNQPQSRASQWSDETQVNYSSKFLTLTAGFLYFDLNTVAGPPVGLDDTPVLTPFPGGVIGPGAGTSYNHATSIAGYMQSEFHLTSQLDLVGGVRVTKDDKSGTTTTNIGSESFTYSNSQPSYSIGLDYKPASAILLYAKYSTAFVSGGQVGPVPFAPETADSWEAGAKTEFLDRRLRLNIAGFDVMYKHLQSAQGGVNVGHPELGAVVIDLGGGHAKGFELDADAVPMKGLTFAAGLGYTDFHYTSVNPILGILGVPATTANYLPTLQPKWSANLSAEYDTPPVAGEARLVFRIDTNWRDADRTLPYTLLYPIPAYTAIQFSPAAWIVNGRIALDRIKLPHGDAQLALWARNITDNKESLFPLSFGGFEASTTFQAARTFGLDFIYDY